LVLQGQTVTERDFQKLVHDHYDRIFRAARFMCGDQHAAEDLVHETFLAAAESIHRFRGHSSVYTWLYGIMLNKFRRWVRRKRTSVVSLEVLGSGQSNRSAEETIPSDGLLPPEDAERKETAEQVREAVGELPVDHRAVITLRFVEGLSYQEIAEAIDCPLGTVKSRIHYALQKIAGKLHDLGPPP
jgi:RNA polymerase sigma-70 factor (ECF subfamily)